MFIGAPLTLVTSVLFAEPPADTDTAKASETSVIKSKGKANPSRDLVRSYTMEDKMLWRPLFHDYVSMKLSISGPGIEPFETTFEKGEEISFGIYDEESSIWSDGNYSWELTATPAVSEKAREIMTRVRNETSISNAGEMLQASGLLPLGQDMQQSGSFGIADGQLVRQKGIRELKRAERIIAMKQAQGIAGDIDIVDGVQLRDQQFLDDLIVVGSECVGQDCVNGESFGFDTARLKENNLRLHFDDTSTSASFPSNDWRLVANDSSNGGLNYFAIEDSTAGRIPFRVEAGARANALYVEADGDVGIGTSNPVVDLHVVDGDTATLRLEQDGSSGFTPQTWDVAGNETNFFIRDATNGSKLPFRIEPSAPQDTLYLENTGDVGVGTNAPDSSLHVRRTNETAKVHIQEVNATTAKRTLLQLTNSGQPTITYTDTAATNEWETYVKTNDRFIINHTANAGFEFQLTSGGNLVTTGTVNGVSDRNAKQGIEPVDTDAVLEKVAALPIAEWSYKKDAAGSRHMGPMAQDFRAQFGLGDDDKTIALTDMSGVALAAVKALYGAMEEKDKEIEGLRSKTAEIEARLLEVLERLEKD
ncbi:MAG: hypothetical protein ACI9R3_004557 [Verrucomicrobiales bacterium]|jgi:hypothetical protein